MLIDTETAFQVLTDYYHHRTETQHKALREALSCVPAVDAVPVVRCMDCKHRSKLHKWYCINRDAMVLNGGWGFCSYGEREKDEVD